MFLEYVLCSTGKQIVSSSLKRFPSFLTQITTNFPPDWKKNKLFFPPLKASKTCHVHELIIKKKKKKSIKFEVFRSAIWKP